MTHIYIPILTKSTPPNTSMNTAHLFDAAYSFRVPGELTLKKSVDKARKKQLQGEHVLRVKPKNSPERTSWWKQRRDALSPCACRFYPDQRDALEFNVYDGTVCIPGDSTKDLHNDKRKPVPVPTLSGKGFLRLLSSLLKENMKGNRGYAKGPTPTNPKSAYKCCDSNLERSP